MAEKDIKKQAPGDIPDLDKAAMVLLSLDPTTAGEIIKNLNPREIHLVSNRMSSLEGVQLSTVRQVVREFLGMVEGENAYLSGGADYIKSIITQALDREQAEYILENLNSANPGHELTIVDALRNVDPHILADFIKGEHPQTIAIILAYMDPGKAAAMLGHLNQEMKNEILTRVAELDHVPPEVLEEVAEVLQNELQVSSVFGKKMGGAKPVAEILNQMDSQSEKEVLSHLEENDPKLVDEIRKLMFVFDDLVNVDDRGVQSLLREIDSKTLATSLRGANDDVKKKFLKNMSQRAAEMLLEDMEAMGPTRLSDIESAQQEIIRAARKLEEEGKIVVAGKGKDEVFL